MTETHLMCLPAGRDNLRYLSGGTRFYGEHPVLPRARGLWEVEFVFAGRARPWVEGTGPEGAPGGGGPGPRLYVAGPASRHGWTDEPGRASEVLVLHFTGVPAELVAALSGAERAAWALDAAGERRFRAVGRELREAGFWRRAEASVRVTAVLVEITAWVVGRSGGGVTESTAEARVERCLHWYRERLTEAPAVAELARVVGCSPAHLRRLFAAAGRAGPREEMARVRMEAAGQCLREGWSQAAVAERLGFSEVSAFARAFRRVTGRPPGAVGRGGAWGR